jgi:zinc ribbon protein
MANHCTTCGNTLRDGDRFCASCGAPVGLSAAPSETATPSQATTYETCEFKWRNATRLFQARFVFYAEARGPKGLYNAGETKPVKGSRTPDASGIANPGSKAHGILSAFIAQLTSHGSETVTDKGPGWYSYKFRRPVR